MNLIESRAVFVLACDNAGGKVSYLESMEGGSMAEHLARGGRSHNGYRITAEVKLR